MALLVYMLADLGARSSRNVVVLLIVFVKLMSCSYRMRSPVGGLSAFLAKCSHITQRCSFMSLCSTSTRYKTRDIN